MKLKIFLGITLLLVALFLGMELGRFIQTAEDKGHLSELSQANGKAPIIERYYTKDSVQHVVTKEVAVRSNAEKAIAVGNGYLDTVAKALNMAVSKLDEVTKVNAVLNAQNIALRQGLQNGWLHYQDKYLQLDYDTANNKVNLSYDVGLNISKYHKRSWLFGAKRLYLDIWSDDNRVKVAGVKRFTVAADKPKRASIALVGGYGYVPMHNQAESFIGLSVAYPLINLPF